LAVFHDRFLLFRHILYSDKRFSGEEFVAVFQDMFYLREWAFDCSGFNMAQFSHLSRLRQDSYCLHPPATEYALLHVALDEYSGKTVLRDRFLFPIIDIYIYFVHYRDLLPQLFIHSST
jgi:hypothetical protein